MYKMVRGFVAAILTALALSTAFASAFRLVAFAESVGLPAPWSVIATVAFDMGAFAFMLYAILERSRFAYLGFGVLVLTSGAINAGVGMTTGGWQGLAFGLAHIGIMEATYRVLLDIVQTSAKGHKLRQDAMEKRRAELQVRQEEMDLRVQEHRQTLQENLELRQMKLEARLDGMTSKSAKGRVNDLQPHADESSKVLLDSVASRSIARHEVYRQDELEDVQDELEVDPHEGLRRMMPQNLEPKEQVEWLTEELVRLGEPVPGRSKLMDLYTVSQYVAKQVVHRAKSRIAELEDVQA